jgi:hypothetical protein
MIFGFQFCVAVFDRDGVLFSPIRDILRDKATFIRVVRRLACDMTSVQLGQDPTVSMIPHEKSVHLRARAKSLTGTDTFPCFSITMGGSDTRRWYTLGPPIWTSISLLGRGTSVWRVCEANNFDDVLVLKSAWRSSKRTAESDIYKSIAGPCTGIALYRCGMDVMFPDDSLITVANLRGDTPGEAEPTPVLHRLLLATLGRPLWEYSSDVELLKGLRAAVKGTCFYWC